mgnify:FL=1
MPSVQYIMRQPLINFLLGILIITLACAALQWMWNANAPAAMQLYHGWALLAAFPITITALHLFLTMPSSSPQAFTRNFMGTTMLKMMVFGGVLVLFLMFSKQDKRVVAVHFLVYYLLFTVFEVVMLQMAIKKK